ncbi:cytochrome P460 family protein [Nitrosococcus watsonii]|uniref:Cytochrome P460 domain-containing protein n=1 Tax=Nitrosococcus watsoni (strain C-113) TaxID=105559 RepID=D8KBU9_NITWC|nr:cytochrome P460 family protein [Nitrosococcus watsonii]ADJ27710.1 conserved hypothetical protein [Nitrosococcus watsonii C-113]
MNQPNSIYHKIHCLWKIASFALISYTAFSPMTHAADSSPALFNVNNELLQPEGYREWVYVGTTVTPDDMNNGKAEVPEFHNIYIDPKSFTHWKKTGQFRDGTMVVKELLSVGAKKALTGNGYFMGEFTGLEAAVKNSKRFPDEPGNWAYFMYGMKYPLPRKATAKPTAECNACHQNNAEDDWVFTQYYPVLQAAKPNK